MRLITDTATKGDWIIIENGAPNPADLSTQHIQFGERKIPAYVDGTDLRIRCPDVKGDYAEISVKGVKLGQVQLRR